jgi:putative mRNA 3-end processing factor
MLVLTPKGLFCPAGNFHIDPKGGVDHAVITHAHSDHARRGSGHYYTPSSGVPLLRTRLGPKINVRGVNYGEILRLGGVTLSFHPAGHILGSAQVRMEYGGEVWVASGDYKREPDPTCEPFEVVKCDVFVTEATFGTPGYSWNKSADHGLDIYEWWMENAERGVNSVLFAYSLGKAQRVLGLLHPYARQPVYTHPAATPLIECYRAQGVKLAPTVCLSEVPEKTRLNGEMLLVPQSFLDSPQARVLGGRFATAFASGWMAEGSSGHGRGHGRGYGYGQNYDAGFTLSDHADWEDLIRTVLETGAKQVYVQHRGNGALVRHLKSLGIQAYPESKLEPENPQQMLLL